MPKVKKGLNKQGMMPGINKGPQGIQKFRGRGGGGFSQRGGGGGFSQRGGGGILTKLKMYSCK
jgi:hypothetical protein